MCIRDRCTGVYLALAVQQLRAEAESTALGIARTLAEDPQVRAEVARISSLQETPEAEVLRNGDCSASRRTCPTAPARSSW